MWFQENVFGPNLYQAKSGVISFWAGGPEKTFSVQTYVKPNLVLSHFGQVVLRKHFQSKVMSNQIWCYLILGGWVVLRKIIWLNLCQAKYIILFFGFPKKKIQSEITRGTACFGIVSHYCLISHLKGCSSTARNIGALRSSY